MASAISRLVSGHRLWHGRHHADPLESVIFLLFFAGFAVFLHRTHYGRVLYAIGNNRQAARFSGVNVGRVLSASLSLQE